MMTPESRKEIETLQKRLASITISPTNKDAHDAALAIEFFLNDLDAVMPLLRKVIKTVDDWNDPRQGNPFRHPFTDLVHKARPAVGAG